MSDEGGLGSSRGKTLLGSGNYLSPKLINNVVEHIHLQVGIQHAPRAERVYVGRHSRDSSTGSSGSAGSDHSGQDQSLHAGVCSQQSTISSIDCQIAGEALELFVTCLSLRQNLISRFYDLPSVSDFIIDTLLGSPSATVRQEAADQFHRLSKIKLVSRSLSLSSGDNQSHQTFISNSPKHFLIQILMKTPGKKKYFSCNEIFLVEIFLKQ